MKLKLYKTVLIAIISFVANGIAVAQTAPATPTAPTAAVAPVITPFEETVVYTRSSQDSTYTSKMRKLQNQMRALSKEISELAREQSRKATAVATEKVAAFKKVQVLRFQSDFDHNQTRVFSNQRFNFNNDTNLQKQVADGYVKERSKTFTKSYPVDAKDKLQIDNRYGKIVVNTWARNEVKVDVDIKAYSLETDDAQKLLDQTSVLARKDANGVNFSTNIDQGSNSWWGSSSNNGKITKLRKVVINYTVYMPAKNPLTITNKYGLVSLPDLSGKLIINNSYGGLVAKDLTNTDNNIVVRYGDANITSLKGSNIDVAYGSLALESADKLTAKISYSTAKIGKLNTSGDINLRYGNGLAINELGRQLKTLNINSSYAPVKVSSTADIDADFDVTVHYGEFMPNSTTKITNQTPDKERGSNNTKTYKGQIGKGSNAKTIVITSRYGGVKFD
ncbi:hypothetical protein [Mucilaginibacter antarcticus]|uniref:Adhesin domain-containing protein n=1 Tax=Mucilaginibacter antarcticus TaxID=1855725 RepID=A0ABW5XPC1_9SPHI